MKPRLDYFSNNECKILQAPLSIHSLELVIEGVKVIVHGYSDSIHAHTLGSVKSLLGTIKELGSDTLLLICSSSVEVKNSSFVFMEISHSCGGQRIALAEIKDRVRSGFSVILLDISIKVNKSGS